MSLILKNISINNFRSYEKFSLIPGERITVLVGKNAAGKTNILEALQLLTAADSFRKAQGNELIRWGASSALIEIRAEEKGRLFESKLEISDSGKKSHYINQRLRSKRREVVGVFPCVVFTPDDLSIVKGSAERRRDLIDGVGDQLSPTYRTIRLEYERIVKQRNLLLRGPKEDSVLLEAWTSRLVERGIVFAGHRRRLLSRISSHMPDIYSGLAAGESLEVTYRMEWACEGVQDSEDNGLRQMKKEIWRRAAEEKMRGVTLVGPHRDDIIFSIDGRDARTYASQGQQRTIALAWKMAEVRVITEITGQPPLLLLDDVMSELDESRRRALTEFIGEAAQTFITTTNLGYFEDALIRKAKVVQLG